MTLKTLIDLLNKAVGEGGLDPDGEVVAATLNGALQADEEALMEQVEKDNDNDGMFYILLTLPDDPKYYQVFSTAYKKEEAE